MQRFDVIIVGGGPAGCAIILSLLKHAKDSTCLLLDDGDPSVFKIGESLPPESMRVLHHIHPSIPTRLAKEVSYGRHSPCTGIASSWALPTQEERHGIMNPFGYGLHLDRAAFDEIMRDTVLQECSKSNNRIHAIKGHLSNISKDEHDAWQLTIEMGRTTTQFSAEWVVDATGRKASIATKLGAEIISPAPLLAFYAVFICQPSSDPAERDNDTRTVIEAIADGWLYSSLTSRSDEQYTRVVAFHTLPSHPAAKRARRYDGFMEILLHSSSYIFPIMEKYDYRINHGYPRCTAAGSSYLTRVCDVNNRWLAVGDAAIAFDPLSSQGIITALQMGLYAGMMLGKHIEEPECGSNKLENSLEKVYRLVREDYEQQRFYYYSIMKRFELEGAEFWKRVVSTEVSYAK